MVIIKKNIFAQLTLAALASASFMVAASPKELSYAIGYPSGSDSHTAAMNFADAVAEYSGDELSIKVYPLSLLNFAETSDGVRDGIADIGYMLAPYFPSSYPHYNFLAENSMLLTLLDSELRARGGMAYNGAMAEFVFFNCPECQSEFLAQNQVYTSNAASSTYGSHCSSPITSIENLENKRLRIGGSAQWSRWAEHFDASPITLSGNDAFEALSQGVVDCVVISAPDLFNLGVHEATEHTTMAIPGGVMPGAAITNVNADVWSGLNDGQRRAILKAAAEISAEIPFVYYRKEQERLEDAKEMGVTIHEADPELLEATRDFVREDMEKSPAIYERKYGVTNGDELLEDFRVVLERWVELTADVESKEELAELYWEEIYSRVNPSTYGM